MKRLTRIIALLTLVSMLAATAAQAEENAFRETFQSAFYGGAAGTLVGAALMAFARKPADHLDYMAYGAAAGVLAGATYGLARSARSLASIDNGTVKIAMPTIYPTLVESPSSRQTSVVWWARLVSGTFN